MRVWRDLDKVGTGSLDDVLYIPKDKEKVCVCE